MSVEGSQVSWLIDERFSENVSFKHEKVISISLQHFMELKERRLCCEWNSIDSMPKLHGADYNEDRQSDDDVWQTSSG